MAQAAVPILNLIILGSFMVYGALQLRAAEKRLVPLRIEKE